MFDHNLDVVKGPSLMHRLDFAAVPDYAAMEAAVSTINEGGLISLNASGKLIAGCPAGGAAAIQPMPMFAIQGLNDFDSNSDEGNISGGVMSGIVATGGFEISTTEFDPTGTYAPNQLLTADGTTLGLVKEATVAPYGVEVIVGCVSQGAAVNADGKNMLTFWTMFLPSAEDPA